MKSVKDLYQRHVGEDIYVIGTAPSIRVFPSEFFEGKTLIGCNMAWKVAPVQYCVTIHPDLNIPEFIEGESPHSEIKWVVGKEKCQSLLDDKQYKYADSNFYSFRYRGKKNTAAPNEPSESGRVVEWAEKPCEDWLYVWSSIAQAAANLAANMGAKNVILVGCDNGPMGQNHHAHAQHTRWKGVDPQHRYMQYYEGNAEVRAALRKRGISMVSLNPFLKLDMPGMDFSRLCEELNVPNTIKGKDLRVSEGNSLFGLKRLKQRLNLLRQRITAR